MESQTWLSYSDSMPELPDITLYVRALRPRIVGKAVERIRIASPFLLHTVVPSIRDAEGKSVLDLHRIGKQIIWELEDNIFMVIHLMIAGRFHWKPKGAKNAGKIHLAAFDFPEGTLLLTEASSKKRASLHLVRGTTELNRFNRGGLDFMTATVEQFREALTRENHTLKRALTDQHLISGIGNSYSDEILHRACLSPLQKTNNLSAEECERLHAASIGTMQEWISRLQEEAGDSFPEKVTAFRPGMAVHGRFGNPCPVCKSKIQRIVYAENECNYCPRCQTGGKILADRSLSRLLKEDWPSTIEELEADPVFNSRGGKGKFMTHNQ
jgi:formamidopyrimidine-DNA glycosylase